LFDYLRKNHFLNESADFVYDFIVDFVESCGYVWPDNNISPSKEYIKNCYLDLKKENNI